MGRESHLASDISFAASKKNLKPGRSTNLTTSFALMVVAEMALVVALSTTA